MHLGLQRRGTGTAQGAEPCLSSPSELPHHTAATTPYCPRRCRLCGKGGGGGRRRRA
uniref:Uncharacterized protein n=1 Tax=Arundo donax TaxID=35708 RepID=A0A0A9C8V7_ARUDO